MQEVWIDRVTGRVCMAVSAKGMAITGIEDRRYWNWIDTEESRYRLFIQLLINLDYVSKALLMLFNFFLLWTGSML